MRSRIPISKRLRGRRAEETTQRRTGCKRFPAEGRRESGISMRVSKQSNFIHLHRVRRRAAMSAAREKSVIAEDTICYISHVVPSILQGRDAEPDTGRCPGKERQIWRSLSQINTRTPFPAFFLQGTKERESKYQRSLFPRSAKPPGRRPGLPARASILLSFIR